MVCLYYIYLYYIYVLYLYYILYLYIIHYILYLYFYLFHLLTVYRFFRKKFSVCFNLFVLLFLVTPCLAVAVQPCIEQIPIKKTKLTNQLNQLVCFTHFII